jgi:hypothetical protein
MFRFGYPPEHVARGPAQAAFLDPLAHAHRLHAPEQQPAQGLHNIPVRTTLSYIHVRLNGS